MADIRWRLDPNEATVRTRLQSKTCRLAHETNKARLSATLRYDKGAGDRVRDVIMPARRMVDAVLAGPASSAQ